MGRYKMEWDAQTDEFGGEPREVWADETKDCKQTDQDWHDSCNAARGCGVLDPGSSSAFLLAMISEKDRAAAGNELRSIRVAPTRVATLQPVAS